MNVLNTILKNSLYIYMYYRVYHFMEISLLKGDGLLYYIDQVRTTTWGYVRKIRTQHTGNHDCWFKASSLFSKSLTQGPMTSMFPFIVSSLSLTFSSMALSPSLH